MYSELICACLCFVSQAVFGKTLTCFMPVNVISYSLEDRIYLAESDW